MNKITYGKYSTSEVFRLTGFILHLGGGIFGHFAKSEFSCVIASLLFLVFAPFQSYAEQSYSIPLKSGENLVVLPATPKNTDIKVVLSGIMNKVKDVWEFNPNDSSDPWKHFRPGLEEYSDLKQMNSSKGYWVNLKSDAVLQITGETQPQSPEADLKQGWNPIVWPYQSSLGITTALSGLRFGEDYDQISTFNNTTKTQEDFLEQPETDTISSFEPGKAYYIHMLKEKKTELVGILDTVPPVISPGQVKTPTNQDVSLSYTVTDNLTAANEIRISGDNSPYITEGAYEVTLTATDKAGNTSTAQVSFTIDKTASSGTIQINSGSPYTKTDAVTLNLSAEDNLGGSGVFQMQFCDDNESWSTAEDYSAAKAWILSSGEGEKKVSVKFSDKAGNWSGVYSDTILFAITPIIGSVLINNGDANVDNWDVVLSMSAKDLISGKESAEQMQFSNDNIFWAEPEDYAVSKSWKLSSGFGTKTVYAKFKAVSGDWSETFSDTIEVISVPKERTYIYLNGQRIAMEETINGVSKKYFFHNDHLGSTNVVSDEAGKQVKYMEYEAFGETKVDQGSLSVNKKFTGRELDDSTGLYDYGARQYDARIRRFISPDPIDFSEAGIRLAGGQDLETFLANPQNLNRYSYCLNNPIRYTDPDGLLTILIHGTYSKPKMFKRDFIERVEETFNEQHTTITFKWSGGNVNRARVAAAKSLATLINRYNFAEGERLNIVAHSHGGNVAFLVSQLELKHKIDTLVTLGTPIREYKPEMENINRIYNVYSQADWVQTIGGGSKSIIRQEYGFADRFLEKAKNINVPITGQLDPHGYLRSEEIWKDYIAERISQDKK